MAISTHGVKALLTASLVTLAMSASSVELRAQVGGIVNPSDTSKVLKLTLGLYATGRPESIQKRYQPTASALARRMTVELDSQVEIRLRVFITQRAARG